MLSEVSEKFRETYPRVAGELLAPFVEVINEAQRLFDGDLNKAHILLAIALRTAAHPDFAEAATNLAAGRDVELPSLWTNVHSIAMSIGAPKETVRRKVNDLVSMGWLERQDGSVRYTAKAALELKPLRDRILKMLISNFRTLGRVLDRDQVKAS